MEKVSKDISVVISVASPKSTLKLVRTTFESILKNLGTEGYQMIIYIGKDIDYEIKDYINVLKSNGYDRIVLLQNEEMTWAQVVNKAIDLSSEYKYFLISHDDVELITENFFPKVEEAMSKITESVGWVSFTDEDYLSGNFAPSTREGFHKDILEENAWPKRKLFQFHNLPDNWWDPSWISRKFGNRFEFLKNKLPREYFESLNYDIPKAPVKCHSPFSHFILIEMEKLKQIGNCEEWNDFSLLVDEDWGLEALRNNFQNIWIPHIKYLHNRTSGGTRAWGQIVEDKSESARKFKEKWGFNIGNNSKEELDFIKEKYKNNLIPWSIGKNSYDWDYIQ